ncbi:N-formylglutamate amidohydrolase [Nitrogeniibacter mangrovi]|uniref:N-formylglutamate amidohydrolase n=2 Tax=Nitrogeniibacter mangrovi TaxID=2016596 RepID=A0A6C1B8Y1_9RHOO|nr:N-formylglutamate amidohydrolase [Nitrogeniibacter mangrovi]
MGLVVSCEHGGNRIPVPCRKYFSGRFDLVRTHRGFDPGALEMARAVASALGAPLLASTISRLVVDLTRSVGHRQLHYDTVREAPLTVRRHIVDTYYRPYRDYAETLTTEAIAHHGRVLHLSCHSFTPELDGVVRNADIGLLYDPKRPAEKSLCLQWQEAMAQRDLRLAIRRNHPYRGDADGQLTTLRRRYSPDTYLGVELEINQRHVFTGGHHWSSLRALIIETLGEILERPIRPDPCTPLSRSPHARHAA